MFPSGRFLNVCACGMMALLIVSCAQIASPTGGPRDTRAPEVLLETPPNYSTRFRSNDVTIEFDEFIQLQNPQSIVISPALDPQPEITAKKEILHIKFKKDLDTNTTYSIFFGSAIGDNNENNKLDNYSYVFSTGEQLDSLKLTARVVSAEGDIPDGAYLLLYRDTDDSAFLKKRPFYLSQIEKNGSVTLGHLKAGTYKVYTLADKNLNYYYDLPSEQIGFLDSAIRVGDSLPELELPLFLPEESRLRITEFDKRIRGGMFRLSFNKTLSYTADEVRVLASADTTWNSVAFLEGDNKQLLVYLPGLPSDSVSYTLLLRHNGQLIDSLQLRCDSRRFGTPVRYFNDTNALKQLTVLETQPLSVRSSYYALSPIDTARIELRDSLDNSLPFRIERDADLCTYRVYADWQDKMAYRLIFPDSAFSDLAGNLNAKQEIRFAALSRKKAGALTLHILLPHTRNAAIVRLKDQSGKMIREFFCRDSLHVKLDAGLLPAGSYQVEVIDDVNGNGIWNSGNYATRTLPESSFKSEKPILIKENWDAEETIQVDYTRRVQKTELPVKGALPGGSPDLGRPGLPGQQMRQD